MNIVRPVPLHVVYFDNQRYDLKEIASKAISIPCGQERINYFNSLPELIQLRIPSIWRETDFNKLVEGIIRNAKVNL